MAEDLGSLINADTKIKVSSTLDKAVGKKFLIDGNPETCWTSQQGTPQYIQITFASPVIPKQIELTFQGGFAGTKCSVEILESKLSDGEQKQKWRVLERIYPEDVNRKQTFELMSGEPVVGSRIDTMKLVFEESSDFFGRVTVYDLRVLGTITT